MSKKVFGLLIAQAEDLQARYAAHRRWHSKAWHEAEAYWTTRRNSTMSASGDYTMTEEDVQRFWNRVRMAGPNDCWIWLGAIASTGYGLLEVDRQSIRAHRAAWAIQYGELSSEDTCHHRCGNRLCVNHNHILLTDRATHAALHAGDPHEAHPSLYWKILRATARATRPKDRAYMASQTPTPASPSKSHAPEPVSPPAAPSAAHTPQSLYTSTGTPVSAATRKSPS